MGCAEDRPHRLIVLMATERMQGSEIPTIDISPLMSGDLATRTVCAHEIGAACRGVGFFQAAGHGIDPKLIAATFAVARDFFAPPMAEKMSVAMSRDTGYRGYFPLEGEITDPAFGGDPKEGFDVALGGATAAEGSAMAGVWPKQPRALVPVLTDYYDAMCGLGRTLSRGFALSLELPEDFFAAALDQPTSILRVLHYPALPALPDPGSLPFGCGAHSDYGYLTMLTQDAQGGLQVQTRAGDWIDVRPDPDAFVCNVGEMMARWTNDVFRATPHRVVRRARQSRYSVPFFFHPNPTVWIEPLPTCVAADGKRHYEPVLSGDYLKARLEGANA